MEKKIEIDNIPKELKGREKIYYDTLKTYKFPRLRIASLKYAVYSFEISEVFKEKISAIRKDITGLKTGINKYKGNKININIDNKKLDEINIKLTQFLTKDSDDYNFYKEYLITIMKLQKKYMWKQGKKL